MPRALALQGKTFGKLEVYRLRREWSVERALTKGVDPAVLLELANDGGPR